MKKTDKVTDCSKISEDEFNVKISKSVVNKNVIKKDVENKTDICRKNSEKIFSDKISAKFNDVEFNFSEHKLPVAMNKEYSGFINSKSTEFIVNPGIDGNHKGKIQGKIGNSLINLIVSKDLFGRKFISGIFDGIRVEITVSKDLFSTCVETKNSKIVLKKNFYDRKKIIFGTFEYSDELVPVILAYIKCYEIAKKENSNMIA